jgi:hypothetical protein
MNSHETTYSLSRRSSVTKEKQKLAVSLEERKAKTTLKATKKRKNKITPYDTPEKRITARMMTSTPMTKRITARMSCTPSAKKRNIPPMTLASLGLPITEEQPPFLVPVPQGDVTPPNTPPCSPARTDVLPVYYSMSPTSPTRSSSDDESEDKPRIRYSIKPNGTWRYLTKKEIEESTVRTERRKKNEEAEATFKKLWKQRMAGRKKLLLGKTSVVSVAPLRVACPPISHELILEEMGKYLTARRAPAPD